MKAYFLSPISDQFNESYGNDPRLMQPSSGKVSPISNVQVERRYDPERRNTGTSVAGGTARAGGAVVQYGGKAVKVAGRSTMRAGAALSATGVGAIVGVPVMVAGGAATGAGAVAETGGRLTRRAGNVRSEQTRRTQQVSTVAQPAQRPRYNPILKKRKSKKLSVKKAFRSARTTLATRAIWSYGLYTWTWFQLPVAILSLLFMGLTAALEAMYASETAALAADSTLWERTYTVAAEIGTAVLSVFAVVTNKFFALFGIDITILNPVNFFMLTHVLVMLFGWGILMAIFLSYTFAGVRPLSGATKMMALLVAIIGYSIPFLNIFPWFLIWTLMVVRGK